MTDKTERMMEITAAFDESAPEKAQRKLIDQALSLFPNAPGTLAVRRRQMRDLITSTKRDMIEEGYTMTAEGHARVMELKDEESAGD